MKKLILSIISILVFTGGLNSAFSNENLYTLTTFSNDDRQTPNYFYDYGNGEVRFFQTTFYGAKVYNQNGTLVTSSNIHDWYGGDRSFYLQLQNGDVISMPIYDYSSSNYYNQGIYYYNSSQDKVYKQAITNSRGYYCRYGIRIGIVDNKVILYTFQDGSSNGHCSGGYSNAFYVDIKNNRPTADNFLSEYNGGLLSTELPYFRNSIAYQTSHSQISYIDNGQLTTASCTENYDGICNTQTGNGDYTIHGYKVSSNGDSSSVYSVDYTPNGGQRAFLTTKITNGNFVELPGKFMTRYDWTTDTLTSIDFNKYIIFDPEPRNSLMTAVNKPHIPMVAVVNNNGNTDYFYTSGLNQYLVSSSDIFGNNTNNFDDGDIKRQNCKTITIDTIFNDTFPFSDVVPYTWKGGVYGGYYEFTMPGKNSVYTGTYKFGYNENDNNLKNPSGLPEALYYNENSTWFEFDNSFMGNALKDYPGFYFESVTGRDIESISISCEDCKIGDKDDYYLIVDCENPVALTPENTEKHYYMQPYFFEGRKKVCVLIPPKRFATSHFAIAPFYGFRNTHPVDYEICEDQHGNTYIDGDRFEEDKNSDLTLEEQIEDYIKNKDYENIEIPEGNGNENEGFFASILNFLKSIKDGLFNILDLLQDTIKNIFEPIIKFFQFIFDFIKNPLEAIQSIIENLKRFFTESAFGEWLRGLLPFFNIIGYLDFHLSETPQLDVTIPFIGITNTFGVTLNYIDTTFEPIEDKLGVNQVKSSATNENTISILFAFLYIIFRFLIISVFLGFFYLFFILLRNMSNAFSFFTHDVAMSPGNIFSFAMYITLEIMIYLALTKLVFYMLSLDELFSAVINFGTSYLSFIVVSFGNYDVFQSICNLFFGAIYSVLIFYMIYLIVMKFGRLN